jgi:hypothetical protein
LSLNRSEKEAVISEVTSLAAKAQTLVMAEYRGITVAAMDQLRVKARSNGVSLSVLKNTLARRAVAGSSFEVVADQMTGPLIYGFSEDAIAAAKVVADFAKTNDKLVKPWTSTASRPWQVFLLRKCCWPSCVACSCPPSPVPLWCWVLWRPRKKAKPLPPDRCAASFKPIVRKSKWHSIKTHF